MITIYGKENCTFCDQAKTLCEMKGVEFEYKQLGVDFERDEFIQEMTEIYAVVPRTMPQIIQDSAYIGGYKELKEILK